MEATRVICYHTTNAAEVILREGFRDNTRDVAGCEYTGVFLADRAITDAEGGKGNQVLEIDFGDDVEDELRGYEWVWAGAPRQWCVPADLINKHATVTLASADDNGDDPTDGDNPLDIGGAAAG